MFRQTLSSGLRQFEKLSATDISGKDAFVLFTSYGFPLELTVELANEKKITEFSWPGDVVGLYDSGNFRIGDTLTEGEDLHFIGVPSFSPEIFRELENRDPMKSKQLDKGIIRNRDCNPWYSISLGKNRARYRVCTRAKVID